MLAGLKRIFSYFKCVERRNKTFKGDKRQFESCKLPGKINAAGNVILANDTAALIHPHLISRAEEVVEEILGVDVRRGTIAGLETVGMVARATNKGVLVHPKTSEEELSELDRLFNVTVEVVR